MNVLHVIHDFLPRHRAGSEIYAYELCRALAARHHVSVLCADYNPALPHGHITWRVLDGLPVIEIINNWQGSGFDETYQSGVMDEQIGHVLDAVQPDVVHVHNLLNLSFSLPAAARARGAAVVATLHDYTLVCASGGQRFHRTANHLCDVIDPDRCARCFGESPFFAQRAAATLTHGLGAPPVLRRAAMTVHRRWPILTRRAVTLAQRTVADAVTPAHIADRLRAARRVFDEVDVCVAPSRSIATEFERLGMDRAKIRVSDYGFPPLQTAGVSGASPPEVLVPAAGILRIGYVGTLVEHKGVHVLIDAVRGLPRGTVELRIFGGTETFPEYTATLRARSAGLPVMFMGAFDRDRVAEVYRQMDVLVVPSLWLENSPLVIHEAFQAGVPVVGARIGGIAELVDDGANGLLYERTSPVDLTRALALLVAHPDRLDAFRERLPAVKSIEQDADEWSAMYDDLRPQGAAGASL